MTWFGDNNNRPLLGSDKSKDDKGSKVALEKEGIKTYKMVSTYCNGCGGEDGNHIPGLPCEGVN